MTLCPVAAFSFFSKRHWLVIESDSWDDLKVLNEIAKGDPFFRYRSLGRLESKWPLRSERLAICRNQYLEEIEGNPICRKSLAAVGSF
jgi:hypothetical protein